MSNLKTHKTTYYHVAIIAAVALFPYLNTFGCPFIFDDFHNITDNRWLKIRDLSLSGFINAATKSPSSNRIIPNISFALNYYFGGFNVWGYHLVNVLIHILTAFTFYFVAQFTLTLPSLKNKCHRPREIALLATLIWSVHPLQTNAVTYIVQRMTSMATFFYLLSLLLFAKGYVAEKKKNSKYLFYISAAAIGIMAFLSKENTAVLPFMLFAYFLYFLKPPENRLDNKKYAILTLSALTILLLALLYLKGNPLSTILSGYEKRHFTLMERLLTESRVIFHYITLIALPFPSRLNFNYDYPVSHSIITPPQTLLAIIGIGFLVYAIKYLYHRDRLTSFTILWFLANLAIESTIIPLELVYEHRLYLPSTFVLLCIVNWIYQIPRSYIKLTRTILVTTLLFLSVFTWHRNTVWQSEITMWSDVVKKSPSFRRGYNNLGKVLSLNGYLTEAETMLLKAIELGPDDDRAYINLAKTYEKQNRLNNASATLQKALNTKKPSLVKIYNLMGKILLKQKNIPEAIKKLTQAIEINPEFSDAYIHLAYAYGVMDMHHKSSEFLLKNIELDPHNTHSYLQLATSYEFQNRYREALMILEKGRSNNNANHKQFNARIDRIKRMMYWKQ